MAFLRNWTMADAAGPFHQNESDREQLNGQLGQMLTKQHNKE